MIQKWVIWTKESQQKNRLCHDVCESNSDAGDTVFGHITIQKLRLICRVVEGAIMLRLFAVDPEFLETRQ